MRLKAYVVRGLIVSSCTTENHLSTSQDVCTGLQRPEACKITILPLPFCRWLLPQAAGRHQDQPHCPPGASL